MPAPGCIVRLPAVMLKPDALPAGCVKIAPALIVIEEAVNVLTIIKVAPVKLKVETVIIEATGMAFFALKLSATMQPKGVVVDAARLPLSTLIWKRVSPGF